MKTIRFPLSRFEFGDNDTLSAIVAALIDVDLLILLSDIDGLYTDDPNKNPDAEFISVVDHLDDSIMGIGKRNKLKCRNRRYGH